MKQKITTLLLLIAVSAIYGQDIKVKKNEVFLNKQKIATIEKVKAEGDKYYQITDLNNNPFCKVKELNQESLTFYSDKTYPYRIFYGDKITDTIAITEKNYYLTNKRIFSYLLKIGLVDTNGLNENNIGSVIKSSKKIPDWISEKLDKEKETVKNKDYKVKRFVNDTLILEAFPTKNNYSQLSKASVTHTKINIYQKDLEDKILIGYAVHEINPTTSETHYFIFNTKDVPLSSYDGFKYKTYYPYKEYGITDNKLKRIKERYDIVLEMALDLVHNEKL